LPETTTYPPRVTTYSLSYSLPLQQAKVRVLSGYEANRAYIRDYRNEDEYMIKSSASLPTVCSRSHLPTAMPAPVLPTLVFLESRLEGGVECDYYVNDIGIERTHVFFRSDNGLPVKLVQEEVHDGVATQTRIYEYSDVKVVADGEWEEGAFGTDGWARSDCGRHVGGFSYIHAFHHYFRV
jgi:hypothetical protein